jgi:transcriptional regulator with XRE-family HTH domain
MLGGSNSETSGRPIGVRLAGWRARRGLDVAEVAVRCGLSVGQLVDLESGRDWVDRRGLLGRAADALRADPGELTGQPYSPVDDLQATVTGFAYRIRRLLGQVTADPEDTFPASVDELAIRMARASAADADGDEVALVTALPELITRAEAAVTDGPPGDRDRARRLRVQGLLLGAGVSRRLGHRDLAWMLVHGAERQVGARRGIVVEQVRLLLACGRPEEAVAWAAHPIEAAGQGRVPEEDDGLDDAAELAALVAIAHAMAGRPGTAERTLAEAERRARSGIGLAAVAAARIVTAVESGVVEEVPGLLDAVDLAALTPAARADLLVTAAGAAARRGEAGEAAAGLAEADRLAPLRVRLDPFARDLLAVLPARTDDPDVARTLGALADRAGLA